MKKSTYSFIACFLMLVPALLSAQKPVIFNHTESINAGETIGIQGSSFGQDPQVWFMQVKGEKKVLTPQTKITLLSHSEMYVAARIPGNLSPGLYAVWVINGNQQSEPVFINKARITTSESDEIMPGTAFRLFGRNLFMKGYKTMVRFADPQSGKSIHTKTVKGDKYVIEIIAPAELMAGVKYNIYISNGAGGKYGEQLFDSQVLVRQTASDPLKLGVPWGADFNFTANTYDIKTDTRLKLKAKGDGITNDQAAIQEAIDKAGKDGGGIIYLPRGIYKIIYFSGSGITMRSNVVLKGDGKDNTFIKYGYGKPFSTERVKAAYGWTLGWPDSRIEGMGMLWPGFITTSGLMDLSCINVNESGDFVHTIKSMPEGGSKLFIKDCGFDFSSGWGLALVNIDKLLVSGCQMQSSTIDVRGINAPTRTWPWDFKNSRNFIIRNNTYSYNAGRFGANGCYNALFENNTFIRNGDHQSKGETGGINFDYVKDMVILGNSFLVKGTPIKQGNQGETILSQGGVSNQQTMGVVTAATATTVTDSRQEWQDFTDRVSTDWQYAVHPTNYFIAIVNGVGTGQWRTIIKNNDTLLTIDRPWDVTPVAGSKYVITQWSAYKALVKDNILKGNHQGIMFYSGGCDIAIVGNKLENSGGIYLRADQRMMSKRYNLSWNVFVANNEVINTDNRRSSFISLMLVQGKEEKQFGTGSIGLEVRMNKVQGSGIPPVRASSQPEGYFNSMSTTTVTNPSFDRKVPGILGTIFEQNVAINTPDAYITGPGAHHTIIAGAKTINASHFLKDIVNEKTKTGAQFTVIDSGRTETVQAVSKPEIHTIKAGDITMDVDANHGARIVSFRFKDQEVLATSKIDEELYGSTFWASPQTWGWPPQEALDRAPYAAVIKKNALSLNSNSDSSLGCRFTKTFTANKDNSISIEYVITNTSTKERSFAPWEITRVPAGGLSFFPTGGPGGFSKSNLVTQEINDITWFNYDTTLVTAHQKMFRSGSEGWLAHANNGLLFIKQFPDININQQAPNEAEVEIYTNKGRTYIELENQGRYEKINPGKSIFWTVRWYLRKLPESISVITGSNQLSGLVRKTINK